MPTVMPLRSGDPRRVGRYRLIGRIEGFFDADGNPDTFLGRAAEGEQVTVTLAGRERDAGGAARDRFTAEARAARRVAPFCVSRLLDAGVENGEPYLVSAYVPGASLREAVEEEGPLAGTPLLCLAAGLAAGLAAIHQAGLVHGAFGPDHVVLSPDGPRIVHSSITPPYGSATPAADLLDWGLTVGYAATGLATLGHRDVAALPEALRGLVTACLSPDPASRPTARTLLARLLGRDESTPGLLAEGTRLASGAARNTALTAPRRPARAARKPRSRAVGWALACAACLLALAAAGWFIALRPGGTRPTPASASADAASSPARAIPPPLAGTWSGQVHQSAPVLAVTVRIALIAGSPGGTITYPALGCAGQLRMVSASSRAVTFAQHISQGRESCDDGLIILTPHGTGKLAFSFRRAGGASPAGVLTRTPA